MENEVLMSDMQSLPSTAKNVVKYTYEKVRPNAVFPRTRGTEDGPIEIIIAGRSDSWIDVKNIIQVIKVKIRKENAAGQPVDLLAADEVVPYCGFQYAMFRDIIVELNGKHFYTSNGFYDLMTYLKILYCAPNEKKERQMLNSLWSRDSTSGHSVISNNVQTNKGQFYRIARSRRSQEIEMSGKLYVDCLDFSRPIPENVTISLKFFPNEAKKCCLSTADLNLIVEIQDMYLMVPRINPKPSLLGHAARLPYVNTQVHRFLFKQGGTTFGPRSIVHSDALPRRCTVILLEDAVLSGRKTQCRQEFKHHDVDQLLITVNGEHLPYYDGFKADFDGGAYSLVYDALFQHLGNEATIDVNREDFTGGFVVFPVDLSQRNVSSAFYPPKKSGEIELQIHFANAPNTDLSILVFLEEERVLSFDKKREMSDKLANT